MSIQKTIRDVQKIIEQSPEEDGGALFFIGVFADSIKSDGSIGCIKGDAAVKCGLGLSLELSDHMVDLMTYVIEESANCEEKNAMITSMVKLSVDRIKKNITLLEDIMEGDEDDETKHAAMDDLIKQCFG
jgi:hypothetical protein